MGERRNISVGNIKVRLAYKGDCEKQKLIKIPQDMKVMKLPDMIERSSGLGKPLLVR
jgi:hypothetical protein